MYRVSDTSKSSICRYLCHAILVLSVLYFYLLRRRWRTIRRQIVYLSFNLMDKIDILQVSCNLLSIFRCIFTSYTNLHDISSVILSACCVIRKITLEKCWNKPSSNMYITTKFSDKWVSWVSKTERVYFF